MYHRAFTCCLLASLPVAAQAPRAVELVPKGSVWRYLDNGSDQGSSWSAPAFDDSAWSQGPAQLGYGESDEATVVSFGPDPANKFITTYFRHSFQVPSSMALAHACLWVQRDDGVVVYLNGVEVARSNMPSGSIGYRTVASSNVSSTDENAFWLHAVNPGLLPPGNNVLAVELHQRWGGSNDVSFDLRLVATDGSPCIVREPYVQRCTPTAAVLRWRTDLAVPSSLWLGAAPNQLALAASDPTPKTEHELAVSGLLPATQHYYAVGDNVGFLAGGDANHWFLSAPAANSSAARRIWVLGDAGTADLNARRVRDALVAFAGGMSPDAILTLGDNAYESGLDHEYQAAFFDMFAATLRQSCVWPAFGNHDSVGSNASAQTGPFFDAFSLPKNAEAGGAPSGTEVYYSFDLGDAHFACVDSEASDRGVSGAMLQWLQADLTAARTAGARWLVAYWHHPPYTKGGQSSDDPTVAGGRMFDMRQNVLPLLESLGVDVVLCGHSHSYERSYLLDGHYGTSNTLTSAMLLDRGDGNPQSDGAYGKAGAVPTPHEGAVYVVAGNSGQLTPGPLNHPAMAVSLLELGALVLDISGTQLDGRLVDANGVVRDAFTLGKGVPRTLTRDLPRISVATGGSQQLALAAGVAHAGQGYVVGGSLGTTPGFMLGELLVPLNPDPYLDLTLQMVNSPIFQQTFGSLDANGKAQAAIVLPPLDSSAIGVPLWHAYVVYDLVGPDFLLASNSVRLLLTQ